jgi:hydrogenase-4 component F
MSARPLEPELRQVSETLARQSSRFGPAFLLFAGLCSLAFAALMVFGSFDPGALGPYFAVDATARLFLLLINTIFVGIVVHEWTRVRVESDSVEGLRVLLWTAFLAASNLAVLSDHFVVTWICLELSTLAAAPLIVRRGAASSRLASWRYLLFSSVGLGLTLLGFICLARGLVADGGGHGGLEALSVSGLLGEVPSGASPWRSLGVALAILGYGAKLGLAPLYVWLPEAYDEAPPPVTSLLAALQFNCALVGLIRLLQVFRAGHEGLVSIELIGMGLATVALAAASLIATRSIRRLVAYASIMHGGVIAVGLGVGAGAGYGVLLYAVSNAFIKAMLFLTAGKIEARYGTKDTAQIRGVIKVLPPSGLFLMAGTFALLGFPPFGSFIGELLILSGLVRGGYLFAFAALGFLVTVAFVATGRTVFPMIWGQPEGHLETGKNSVLFLVPKLAFLLVLVVLGLHLPDPVNALFHEVAVSLGDE